MRRATRRTLFALLALPLAVLLWNTPLSTGHTRLVETDLAPYVAALRAHGRPPAEYVVEQFGRRDVVILGEAHRVRQDVEFVQSLLPLVHARAGVRTLVIEFGSATSQKDADRLVRGEAFDRALARRLLGEFRDSLWLYEEYLGLYEAAWRLNRSLGPGEEPFRILLGSVPRDVADKDASMAAEVLEEVEAGRKVLVYCGAHHGFTRYRQPIPFLSVWRTARGPGRMGNRLHAALGDRVAFVTLHAPFAKRWAFFAWPAYGEPMLSPFRGVLDQAQGALETPVAFDTSIEPLASLTDTTSYYSLHRGAVRLSDFADGYVILAPLAPRRAVRPIEDLDEADLEIVRRRYQGTDLDGRFADLDALREFVREDGLMPEEAFALVDRAGLDEPSCLPEMSAFWPVAGLAVLAWAVRRWRRRRARGTSPDSGNPESKAPLRA